MALNALVTGGGSGIGRGIALALARRGVNVALAGRRATPLAEVTAELLALGARAVPLSIDLAHDDERARLLNEVHAELGQLDILVHSAGVFCGGELESLSQAEIERAVAVNLSAAIDLTRLALPDIRMQRGSLVFVGSNASFVPLPFATLYSASKAGVRAFGESLRYELDGSGVNVLMVYPPDTASAMTAGMAANSGVANYPLASPAQVGERIAAAIFARKRELRWGARARVLQAIYHYAPWLVERMFRAQRTRFARMMAATRPDAQKP